MSRNKNEKSIEDAAIRLAANAYVDKEGEKIIEEAKKLNQEKQVSDEQLAEFARFCNKEFAKLEWKSKLRQASKVAVAAVAVFVFVSGIHQFNMTYNNPVEDERGTIRNGVDSEIYQGDDGLKIAPTYVPEGFLKQNINYAKKTIVKIDYSADEQKRLTFYCTLKEENQNNETSNDENEEIIDINGSQAKVTRKPDENIVTVTWEKGEHIFCVEAQGVDEDEVIKVAKSVQRVNED